MLKFESNTPGAVAPQMCRQTMKSKPQDVVPLKTAPKIALAVFADVFHCNFLSNLWSPMNFGLCQLCCFPAFYSPLSIIFLDVSACIFPRYVFFHFLPMFLTSWTLYYFCALHSICNASQFSIICEFC